MPQIVIFSDLDATLLDHHTYSFAAAQPALDELRARQIPVVLNSSKTRPEMERIRERMANPHPYIIENGAALVIPAGYFDNEAEQVVNFATAYDTICHELALLSGQGYRFRGFSNMSDAELSALTELSVSDAALAKQRVASEPLLWEDTPDKLAAFQQAVESRQLRFIKGGRFYHVTGPFDKGTAIAHTLSLFQKKYPDSSLVSIGLGDSPNDIAMLNAVDHAVVIESERRHLVKLQHDNVTYSAEEGPLGWNTEILTLLKRYRG